MASFSGWAAAASGTVNGGGKVGHVGGSIVGLRLSTFSEKVLANWPAETSHSLHGKCDIDAKAAIVVSTVTRRWWKPWVIPPTAAAVPARLLPMRGAS